MGFRLNSGLMAHSGTARITSSWLNREYIEDMLLINLKTIDNWNLGTAELPLSREPTEAEAALKELAHLRDTLGSRLTISLEDEIKLQKYASLIQDLLSL